PFTSPSTFSNATKFALFTGGNVGIGTRSPAAPLSVGNTSQFQVSSVGAVTSVGVANTGTAITNNNAYTQSGTNANTFTGTSTFSNATNSAFFTGGGVGIGTTATSASTALDVRGNPVKVWTGSGTDTNSTAAGELYVQGDLEVDGLIYGDGSQLTGLSAAGGWTDGGTTVYNS